MVGRPLLLRRDRRLGGVAHRGPTRPARALEFDALYKRKTLRDAQGSVPEQ
jgi:hypothetical protein